MICLVTMFHGNALKPLGFGLTGDIRAGRRRLVTYFIYPIIRTIETSFSEPGR